MTQVPAWPWSTSLMLGRAVWTKTRNCCRRVSAALRTGLIGVVVVDPVGAGVGFDFGTGAGCGAGFGTGAGGGVTLTGVGVVAPRRKTYTSRGVLPDIQS